MSDQHSEEEAFERLSRQNPATPADLQQAASGLVARRGLASILSSPRIRRWWQRRRIVIPVVIAVAAAASATTYALTRPVSDPAAVGCFEGPSLSSPSRVVALDRSPLETCAAAWASGELGSDLHPPLVVCVRASGSAAVFPSRNAAICRALGLSTPSNPTLSGFAQKVERLQSLLGEDATASLCLSPEVARRDARTLIEQVGLSGWSVTEVGRFTSARPCGTFSIAVGQHTVALIPAPRRSSSGSS